MKENIGNVVIDYKFYPGQDLYSDGKVEEELLEISKNYKESELNQVIAERNSWPVLYHFSHVRENIVNWLPIKADETVLEIGSGCGAITGALAKKAKKVTCIELSKQRSMINAYRHQDDMNIEILLGNFQDVVNDLNETFDYITLIGVFEYSEGYIQTDNPYVDMLKRISPLLKPEGKLVIAIENRLGLKYWAGCTEDHVGRYFEGIEGYPGTKGVRTFSKKELDDIFKEAGDYFYQMYYPYPDYKFPTSIYSDKRLPAVGELRENNYNFDRERLRLFDETRVYDSLITNDLYKEFSNSFLIIATKEQDLKGFETSYVKYSNERADEFSLRTEIRDLENNKKEVLKLAETEQSRNHLQYIYHCYNKLTELYKNTPIRLNRCIFNSENIELEFLQGSTLEEILDFYVEQKEYEKVWEVLKQYLDTLSSVATESFVMTKEFEKVFGYADISEDEKCAPITNIDAICANIIWGKDIWQMLDYEWSFEFPIPVEFQIYRVLKYYLYASTLRGCLHEFDFFGRVGITKEKIEMYDEMERHFQQYILGDLVPMRDMYASISPGILENVKTINPLEKKLRVYIDYGSDFSEDNSYLLPRGKMTFQNMINLPKRAVRLRLDPCEEKCLVYVKKLVGILNDQEVDLSYICNGIQLAECAIYFDTSDPYFIIEQWPEKIENIYVDLEIQTLGEQGKSMVGELYKSNQSIKQENQILNQKYEALQAKCEAQASLIREMENTKIWKAYSFYKKRSK